MLARALLLATLLLAGADAKRLSRKEYNEKAKQYRNSHSKSDFVEKIDENMSTERGDRAWAYFQEQLDDGRIVFTDDSGIQFMLPPSHAFSKYTDLVHPAVADGVETLFRVGRAVYFGTVKALPSKVQNHHDDFFHFLFDSVYVRCAARLRSNERALGRPTRGPAAARHASCHRVVESRRARPKLNRSRAPLIRNLPAHPRAGTPCTASSASCSCSW